MNQPYIKDETPGTIAWCACGKSENQPYCDGSHKGTDITPIMREVTRDEKIAWCGCKQSGNKPLCDGTHEKLE